MAADDGSHMHLLVKLSWHDWPTNESKRPVAGQNVDDQLAIGISAEEPCRIVTFQSFAFPSKTSFSIRNSPSAT